MQRTIQYIKNELNQFYPANEIRGFVRLIMEKVYGLSYTDMLVSRDLDLKDTGHREIEKIVARLKKHEPVQYILGETEFFGLKLKVAPGVLIPRPETEELVQWIGESEINSSAKILDIGTGSGCIALAIKTVFHGAFVTGLDISETALSIARENAGFNKLDCTFFQADILRWKERSWPHYDVVVSNPPYVRESEKRMMEKNVLDHEPVGALFVPDHDSLIYYRHIAAFARKNLCSGGWLFFEINEFLGKEMKELLAGFDFRQVEIRKDINGRDRMLRCRR